MEQLSDEDWEDIEDVKGIDILPTELWLQILRCLMPGKAHLHVKWSSPKHKTLSHMKCLLNEHKTFIYDMYSFGQTCKEALEMRDQIFRKQLCLHFDSKSVLRKFIKIHPRLTIGNNEKNHQSFKEIHLALRKIDDSTIKSIEHLHGLSVLEVYLLQPPGKQILNERSIHDLEEILQGRAKTIKITTFDIQSKTTFRIPSINLKFHSRSDLETISELREMEKKSDGYAYGYPHENCEVDWALYQLKIADRRIYEDKIQRKRRKTTRS